MVIGWLTGIDLLKEKFSSHLAHYPLKESSGWIQPLETKTDYRVPSTEVMGTIPKPFDMIHPWIRHILVSWYPCFFIPWYPDTLVHSYRGTEVLLVSLGYHVGYSRDNILGNSSIFRPVQKQLLWTSGKVLLLQFGVCAQMLCLNKSY